MEWLRPLGPSIRLLITSPCYVESKLSRNDLPSFTDWLMVGCDQLNFLDSPMVVTPSSPVAQ
ncbi:hypothetical protein DSCW_09010 [Desulfosarcina widdelii]|uniref:Uncharacterized protein n=1 Tax=Desulfosarcina widdelii TaxID=947919 RepID=A0A5K7Z4V0_9BACT|nr:hypothetical protein DSCW_09010 [Desulfosarcina widdelii]